MPTGLTLSAKFAQQIAVSAIYHIGGPLIVFLTLYRNLNKKQGWLLVLRWMLDTLWQTKKCIRVLSHATKNAFVYITSGMQGFQQGAQLSQHQQHLRHTQAPNIHPVGPEQLQQACQHGIHQAPLSHQQPWFLQPQHGVQQPPPGQQQSGYHQPHYDVQYPPPGQQQPAYRQPPNAVQESPLEQQPSHPHPQHIDQHPPTGQNHHTNTKLSSGQFTTERRGIL